MNSSENPTQNLAQNSTPKRVIQQKQEVETTAANQHNSYLHKSTAQKIKENKLEVFDKQVVEWYFRTLGDEIYKLSFIDKDKYNRVKIFWPSQVQEDQSKQNKESDIRFWLDQFEGFDLEDYFDIIIYPAIEVVEEKKNNINITLKIYFNGFTMQNYQNNGEKRDYSTQAPLYLFYKVEKKFNDLAKFTNTLINNYIVKDRNQLKLDLNESELKSRFVPIIAEDTRLLLYELYRNQ